MMKGIKLYLLGISLLLIGFSCSEEEDDFDEIAQYAEDLGAIDKYINENNITDTLHHFTGIRYTYHEEGNGIRATVGLPILVEYKGYFLDGEVFDEGTFGDDPKVILNSGSMISGWFFMCQELREGDSVSIYLPSVYGYGRTGSPSGTIPPNTPIAFDMKLLRVGD